METHGATSQAEISELHAREAALQTQLDSAARAHFEQTQSMQENATAQSVLDKNEISRLNEIIQDLQERLNFANKDIAVVSSVGVSQAETITTLISPLLELNKPKVDSKMHNFDGGKSENYNDETEYVDKDTKEAMSPHRKAVVATAKNKKLKRTLTLQFHALEMIMGVVRQCTQLSNTNDSLKKTLSIRNEEIIRLRKEAHEAETDNSVKISELLSTLESTRKTHTHDVNAIRDEMETQQTILSKDHAGKVASQASVFTEEIDAVRSEAATEVLEAQAAHADKVEKLKLTYNQSLNDVTTELQAQLDNKNNEQIRLENNLQYVTTFIQSN